MSTTKRSTSAEREQPPAPVREEQMYEVTVPHGLAEGQTFLADVGGVRMSVEVPPGIHAGDKVRVAAPPSYEGRPLSDEEMAQRLQQEEYVNASGGRSRLWRRDRHADPILVTAPPGTVLVETEHVSPAGLFCCLLTCPFIFPFNLLGLLFTERRLTPVRVSP